MKKSKSIAVIIILLICTVLMGYTVLAGWGENKSGSIYNINTGLDLSGGVSITYQAVESNPSQEDMDDTNADVIFCFFAVSFYFNNRRAEGFSECCGCFSCDTDNAVAVYTV